MSRKEKILFALILFFQFSLFLPRYPIFNIIATLLMLIYSVAYNPLKDKMRVIKERKYLQWMLIFFAMIIVSGILSDNVDKVYRYGDSRLALLYLPLFIGTLRINRNLRDKVLLGVALLITFMCILCLASALYRSDFLEQPEFLYNDAFTKLLGQQSVYTSLLVNVAIYTFAYHIIFLKNRYKGWMILAVIFLLGASYLLGSRIMMSILYVTIFVFGFYYIINRKKYLAGIMLLLGLLAGVFLVYTLFPKTFNRFKELSFMQFEYGHIGKESHFNMDVSKDQWNGANFRLAAWRCGWELFLQNPVKGVDIGDKHDELMKKYQEKNFQFAINTNKNVHNNYLDILYSMGLIGLSLFLIGWVILPVLYAKKKGDRLAMLVILTFAAAWITEIYFDRTIGGMLTGFFIPFILADEEKNK